MIVTLVLVVCVSALAPTHFWATDDAAKLAQGPKAALHQTNSQK